MEGVRKMTIIEKMFYGDFNFGDESPEERDVELEKKLDDAKDEFCKKLSEEQIAEFEEIISLELQSTVTDQAYFFRRGFETGFQLSQELKEG